MTYRERLPIIAGFVTPFGGEPMPIQLMVDSGGSAVKCRFLLSVRGEVETQRQLRDARDAHATMFTGDRPSKRGRVQALSIGGVRLEEPEVQILGEVERKADSRGGTGL